MKFWLLTLLLTLFLPGYASAQFTHQSYHTFASGSSSIQFEIAMDANDSNPHPQVSHYRQLGGRGGFAMFGGSAEGLATCVQADVYINNDLPNGTDKLLIIGGDCDNSGPSSPSILLIAPDTLLSSDALPPEFTLADWSTVADLDVGWLNDTIVAISSESEGDNPDGVDDGADNCVLVANAGQEDYPTGSPDGRGNACDGDYNNDGVVDGSDHLLFAPCFGVTLADNTVDCAAMDHNVDGVVDGDDFLLYGAMANQSAGVSCSDFGSPWTCP